MPDPIAEGIAYPIKVAEFARAVGPRGAAVEIQTTPTHIQWRNVGDAAWQDVIAIADLEGDPGTPGTAVEIGTDAGSIVWRYVGDVDWTPIVALTDLEGEPGDPGAAGTLTIGDVTTLAPGASATVENVGTPEAAILNIGIPAGAPGAPGDPGDPGAAATVQVGDVTTGAPGSAATVENAGTVANAVLNFTIPAGDTGDPGGDGLGFTGGSYDDATGKVTFTSEDGLGFETGDLRGSDGIGVPDPSAQPDGKTLETLGGALVYVDPSTGLPSTDGASEGYVLTLDAGLGPQWSEPTGGSGGGTVARTTLAHATASLADSASEETTVALGKTFDLIAITADVDCRVQLYATAAGRTADAGRSVADAPSPSATIIADISLLGGDTLVTSPRVIGSNYEASPTADIPIRITNVSGATTVVDVTFTHRVLEA